MSDLPGEQYTSLDFLSKLRNGRRGLFKHLSLNVDLEEINQVLSPRPVPIPPLDPQQTRTFLRELMRKY